MVSLVKVGCPKLYNCHFWAPSFKILAKTLESRTKSGPSSSDLSHQVNRGLSLGTTNLKRPGGAIYNPLLVLNHTA